MSSISVQRGGTGGAKKSLSNLASVAINANLVPDAGSTYDLGSSSEPWASLFVDTVGIGVIPLVGTKLAFPIENDAATPTLAFGGGGDGLYSRTDTTLSFALQSTWAYNLSTTNLSAVVSGAFQASLRRVTPSATVPSVVPGVVTSSDTGIGLAAAGQLSLIAGGNESLRLTNTGVGSDIFVDNGFGVVIGHTAKLNIGGVSQLQILGTTSSDSAVTIGRWSNNASPPKLSFVKSRGATIGSSGIANDNDVVGMFRYCPDDGVAPILAAQFSVEVDDASIAVGDIGVAFVWEQMPGGGVGGALRETMRLSAAGKFGIGAVPLVGFHAAGLVEGTGDLKDIVALFQGATGGTQNGYLFTSDDVASDVWIALRGVPADTNQWMIGARFFSGDTFAIGYGSKATDMTFPLDVGAKFVIETGGHVGIGTTTPATSALLELSSTTGALLVPRMTTTQRNALTVSDGMIIYNVTTATMQGRINNAWANM